MVPPEKYSYSKEPASPGPFLFISETPRPSGNSPKSNTTASCGVRSQSPVVRAAPGASGPRATEGHQWRRRAGRRRDAKNGPQGAQLRPTNANISPLSPPVPPGPALVRKCAATARTVPRPPGRAAHTALRKRRKWRPRRRPAPRRPKTPHRPETRPRDVHLGPLSPPVPPGSVLVRIYVDTGRIRPVHRKTPKV